MFYCASGVGHRELKLSGIAVNRVLNDEGIAERMHFGELVEKWPDVLRPENEAVYIFSAK